MKKRHVLLGMFALTACASAGARRDASIPVLTTGKLPENCDFQSMGNVSIRQRSSASGRVTIAEFQTSLARKAKADGADAVVGAGFRPTTYNEPGVPKRGEVEQKVTPEYIITGTMVRFLNSSCSK